MIEKKPKIIATEARLSKQFKMAERTCREHFKAARCGPGKYDFLQCVDIYVEKNNPENKTVTENDLNESRKNLNEAKYEILIGNYAHVDEVTEIVSKMIFTFKSKLLSLSKKIPPDLYGDKKNYEKIILKHILKTMKELKEYDRAKQDQDAEESGEAD